MRDIPSDLDTSLGFSSLQSETGSAQEVRDLRSSMDFGAVQSHHHYNQPLAQEPPWDRGGGRPEQTDLDLGLGFYSLQPETGPLEARDLQSDMDTNTMQSRYHFSKPLAQEPPWDRGGGRLEQTDLDLGLEFYSLQPETGPLEARNLQSDMDLGTTQSPHSNPDQPPRDRSVVQRPEQEHQSELHGASQDSYSLSSSASTLLSPCPEAPAKRPRHQLSLARNVTQRSLYCQSQEEANAHVMNFDQDEGPSLITDSEGTGPDSGYGKSASSRPQSTRSDIQGSYNMGQKTTNPIVDTVVTSWIRDLSDINVELHQHILSIPSPEVEQSPWTSTKGRRTTNIPNSAQHDQELPADRTFNLSLQYTEILNNILSRLKARQAYSGPTTAALASDQQPPQLLVLSGYLYLVESYGKILQHIKSWTEVRLKMGLSTSDEYFPIQLPGLAIGSFKMPTPSPTRPLVLVCIIKAMIVHIHDLISEMMGMPNPAAGEQGADGGNGLSGVAQVMLQAIRAKEDSIMKLLHGVWSLALRCGIP